MSRDLFIYVVVFKCHGAKCLGMARRVWRKSTPGEQKGGSEAIGVNSGAGHARRIRPHQVGHPRSRQDRIDVLPGRHSAVSRVEQIAPASEGRYRRTFVPLSDRRTWGILHKVSRVAAKLHGNRARDKVTVPPSKEGIRPVGAKNHLSPSQQLSKAFSPNRRRDVFAQ